jgi:hypothetical protein
MRPLHQALSIGLAVALSAGTSLTTLAATKTTHHHAVAAAVDPDALQALQRMSAYLGTLPAFEIKVTTATELVMDDDQKIEEDGVNTYKVHRPDGFMIETASDDRLRQFFYNGKVLTIFAPKLGYYVSVPAPPTIRQTLDLASEKYDVDLPLADLFRWSDPNSDRPHDLQSGFHVGTATLDGVETDQYAFREGDIDWQIWIAQGPQPVPLKVVMIDRTDASHPYTSARLDWNTSPTLAAADFTYTPGADAKAITIAQSGK